MIKVGDILEIPTRKGLSYALVVFDYKKPPSFGSLVKVSNRKFEVRPELNAIVELLKGPEDFYSFVGFNNKMAKELGINIVANIGDQGFTYNNLPLMWIFRKGIDTSFYPGLGNRASIPKQVILQTPGGPEKKLSNIAEVPPGTSQFSIVNLIALRDLLEENYSPKGELLRLWEES